MSKLSKRQKLSDNRRTDLFEDRIFDNLSEAILQYLSIEDKFRFECVSKQFQRTVFQRHYELNIEDFSLKTRNGINLKTLELSLKKLPQIKCLRHRSHRLRSYNRFRYDYSDIEPILENCNNLVEIDLDLDLKLKANQQLLVQKLGLKLVSFTSDSRTIKEMAKLFPSIKEIKILLNSFERTQLFALPVNNLKKISLQWDFTDRNRISLLKGFGKFVENNKSLTHLTTHWNDFYGSEKDLLLISKQISQLNQLVLFKQKSCLPIKLLAKFLSKISKNCLQIKCLDITTNQLSNETDVQQLMSVLMKFNGLKRLKIKFSDSIPDIDSILNISFRTGFKGLTHLSLDFGSNELSIEKLFKDIGSHSPDLIYLNIRCEKIIVSNELAVTFNQFSRLECLIISFFGNKTIGDSIKTEVTNNCKNIKTIDFPLYEY